MRTATVKHAMYIFVAIASLCIFGYEPSVSDLDDQVVYERALKR
jgi:hypothetical protein